MRIYSQLANKLAAFRGMSTLNSEYLAKLLTTPFCAAKSLIELNGRELREDVP
jgi:hypothetical protein